MTKKALNFCDFQKAITWEAAGRQTKLKQTQSVTKEFFVDRMTGHRDALKPAETCWTRQAEREANLRLQSRPGDAGATQSAPNLKGRQDNHVLAAARAREAKQRYGAPDPGSYATSNTMPWYSKDAMSGARSAPPEW